MLLPMTILALVILGGIVGFRTLFVLVCELFCIVTLLGLVLVAVAMI